MNITESQADNPYVRLRARTRMLGSPDRILLQIGDRTCKIQPGDDATIKLLHALSRGGRTREILVDCSDEPDQCDHLARIIAELNRRGFLEGPPVTAPCMTDDLARFDRFLHFLADHETPERSRYDLLSSLRRKTVVVVGIGGQGSWLVYHLLCIGIGCLVLVDGDVVSASNLNRSILYNEKMVGMWKVDAAEIAIIHFAPRTDVRKYPIPVHSPDDLVEVVAGSDLVIGVADYPPRKIKHWIGEACHTAGIPSLQASGLRVGPFVLPGETACVGCDWRSQLDRNPDLERMLGFQVLLPIGSSGAISPVASITAGVMAMEVLRYFLGVPLVTRNRIWEMNGDLISHLTVVQRHKDCAICS